jgi:hypothetical protein
MRARLEAVVSVLWTALAALPGCGASEPPPEARLVEAREVEVLAWGPAIQGRDGGSSGVAWGRSIWAFGDTVLTAADAEGTNWHHNSWSWTTDRDARDGIGPFVDRADGAGAPVYLVAPTAEEAEFNREHRGDPCEAAPCGARWAAWPGAPVWDAVRDRALVFYGLIYGEPGEMNFHGVGQGVAVWEEFEALPTRPEVAPGTPHPTLLFVEGEPSFGMGALIDGDDLYAWACDVDWLSCPCLLARVPAADVLDRAAWRFWTGEDWSEDLGDARSLFDGGNSLTVSWNAFLGRWVAVHPEILSSGIALRTAPALTGPWSGPLHLFDADRKGQGEWTYDAVSHPELDEDGGRVLHVTFTRPNGVGWFGSEMPHVRVELAVPGP